MVFHVRLTQSDSAPLSPRESFLGIWNTQAKCGQGSQAVTEL